MIVNGKDISVADAIEYTKIESDFLKRRKNNLLLSDRQVEILTRNGIDYKKYSDLSSLLFDIEECLNNEEDYELEEVSKQLAEIHYYSETNK